MTILTEQEREKFATWLEEQAKSDDDMAEQIERLPGHDRFSERMKTRSAIFRLVAAELRGVEGFSI